MGGCRVAGDMEGGTGWPWGHWGTVAPWRWGDNALGVTRGGVPKTNPPTRSSNNHNLLYTGGGGHTQHLGPHRREGGAPFLGGWQRVSLSCEGGHEVSFGGPHPREGSFGGGGLGCPPPQGGTELGGALRSEVGGVLQLVGGGRVLGCSQGPPTFGVSPLPRGRGIWGEDVGVWGVPEGWPQSGGVQYRATPGGGQFGGPIFGGAA